MNNKQLQNKANLNHLEECKVRRKLIKKLFKRRKFQYWYLADSGSFFCYYADALNITVELTTPNCMTDYLPSYTYYDTLIFNINAYNRCFYDLAKRGEIVAAYPLVRLVADNFKIMVAEYLYPDKILPKIIGEGKELNQIRVKGEKLKDSDVNKAISELFPEYPEIYKQYSHYIHPSKEGNILAKVYFPPFSAFFVKAKADLNLQVTAGAVSANAIRLKTDYALRTTEAEPEKHSASNSLWQNETKKSDIKGKTLYLNGLPAAGMVQVSNYLGK